MKEKGPQTINTSDIRSLVTMELVGDKGRFNSIRHSPKDLIGPSLEYLISLQKAEEQDAMKVSYQTHLTKIESPEDQLSFIFSSIISEWQRNMP